ncbi:MAG: hypothetical protein QW568_00370 [Candidatus Anstonellaceae archaeon]
MAGKFDKTNKVLTESIIHDTLARMDNPDLKGILPRISIPQTPNIGVCDNFSTVWAENTRGFFPNVRQKHSQPHSPVNLILPQRARMLR